MNLISFTDFRPNSIHLVNSFFNLGLGGKGGGGNEFMSKSNVLSKNALLAWGMGGGGGAFDGAGTSIV